MQSFKLPDAVIDVNDVIPGLQLRKIAEETGRLGAPLRRALQHGFKNVAGPEDGDARIEKHDTIRERSAAQDNRGNTAGRGVFGKARAGGVLLKFAETEWNFVFVAQIDVTFELTEAFRGQQFAIARGN